MWTYPPTSRPPQRGKANEALARNYFLSRLSQEGGNPMTHPDTTPTAAAACAMESYTFLKRVSEFMRQKRIDTLNALPAYSFERYLRVLEDISLFAKYSYQHHLAEEGIPIIYREACYGIGWAMQTGRVNGETEIAIKALSVVGVIQLVHSVEQSCRVHAEVPSFLMARYTHTEEGGSDQCE
jgi:hypothetical protein